MVTNLLTLAAISYVVYLLTMLVQLGTGVALAAGGAM